MRRFLPLALAVAALGLALPAAAPAAVTFSTPQSLPLTADEPTGAATADFNGDGRIDVAFSHDVNQVGVLLNETAPGGPLADFLPEQTLPAPSATISPVAVDFNGDGRPDIAVSEPDLGGGAGDGAVGVYLNTTPAGAPVVSFTFAQYPLTGRVGHIAAADFVPGSVPDIVATQPEDDGSDGVVDLPNDGSGDFSSQPFTYETGANPGPIAVTTFAPLSLFGVPALFTGAAGDDALSLSDCGCGGSGPQLWDLLPGVPVALGVAQLTDDDVPDVVAASQGASGGLSTFVGQVSGSVQPRQTLPLAGLNGLATGRLDPGPAPDVLATTATSAVPLLNNGTGDLAAGAPVALPTSFGGPPALVDLNDDGANDVVVPDIANGRVIALMNAPLPASLGLDVGDVTTGTPSAALPVAFENTGSAPLVLGASAVAVGGADASDVAVLSDTCSSSTVPAGQSCSAVVQVTPGGDGDRVATLVLTSENADPSTAALAARGIPPVVGPAGPTGDPGDPGANGAQGPAGAKGPAGATGANGAQGSNGTTGATGPSGDPGRKIVSAKPLGCRRVSGTRTIDCRPRLITRRNCQMQATLVRGGKAYATSPWLRGCRTRSVALRWSGRHRPAAGAYTLVLSIKQRGRLPWPAAVTANVR